MPSTLQIIIVGAGISGLASAIALSRNGHKVTVFERRPNTNEQSGSGVQLQPSGVKILQKWGLLDQFDKIAHESGVVKIIRYADGDIIAEQSRKGPRRYAWMKIYGIPTSLTMLSQWYCLRNELRNFLYDTALSSGAEIHFNSGIQSVDLSIPCITFADGTTASADLIVGADGTNSVVRKTLYPYSGRLITKDYVFQALIPREVMYQNEITRAMYEDHSLGVWVGPNSWALTSTAPHQEVYDMQVLLQGFADSGRDPNPDKHLELLENLNMVGDQLDAWTPFYRDIWSKVTKFLKWRLVEAPLDLPSALSPNGRVVIVGDAYHGQSPNAGFGSVLAIEEGARLAALLSKTASAHDVPRMMEVHDRLQRRRSGAIRKHSAYLGRFFCMPDGPQQKFRDEKLAGFDPNRMPNAKPSLHATYGSAEWQSYMDDYDPEQDVAEALSELSQRGDHASQTVGARL
jgi:salicylate hydroxylase